MKPAKRKLTDIDFSSEGAHIALCHKDQGVANQAAYALVLKADYSDEFIQKLQTVRVELELPDFIQAFWKINEEEDAKALAYLMGWREDLEQEAKEPEMDFQDWVKSNMESFEIVKALKDSDNYAEVLANLDEHQYLALLQDQQRFEKGLKKVEEQKQQEARIQAELIKAENLRKKPKVKKLIESTEVEKSTEADVNTSITQREVEKEGKGNSPVVKTKSKEKLMTKADKVTVVEQTVDVEMVEKSQLETIQKQFQEQQEQLQKALATVAQFEQEKKELIAKQRKQDVLGAVKDEAKAEVLFKAVKDASDEDFQAVVKALGDLMKAVENSDLFVEKGVQVDDKPVETESAVAKALRAKLQAK